MSLGKRIFEGPSPNDIMVHLIREYIKNLENMSENDILSRSNDDIIEGFKQKNVFDIPILRDAEPFIDTREVKHERDIDDYGSSYTQTFRTEYVDFYVPFSGDSKMFYVSPSNRRVFDSSVVANNSEVTISVSTQGGNTETINRTFEDQLVAIKAALDVARTDFASFAQMIDGELRPRLEYRRSRYLRANNLVADLGFPMRRRVDAPTTYKAPEVKRKIAPVTRPASVTAAFKPEPALDEAEYQHILSVMDSMTKVMERSPHSFANMGEENIRQHFLVQLNGHYEGQATGETFNFEGKTDILIRSNDKNIFIAECKFWTGEKGFNETVDQLLGYLSWRDTKTAVVMFSRNKDTTAVIETIKTAVTAHAHYKRGPKVEGLTRLRYTMGHPSDHNREMEMTVLVYDIPKIGK